MLLLVYNKITFAKNMKDYIKAIFVEENGQGILVLSLQDRTFREDGICLN